MTVLSLIKEIDMKDIIVCDLDGTLANCEHRVHHVRSKPKNWDAFYAGVKDDTVNHAVHEVLINMCGWRMHQEYRQVNAIFCTGRPERCRSDTEAWLMDNTEAPSDFILLMRKDGDFRADHIVKQEILDTHIDKERVLFVLDDRQQVVDMWRRNGITCFQVAAGDF
jgi:hypothetical protein